MSGKDLFNCNLQLNEKEYNEVLFEQYKLYVDSSDKISQRRVNTNTFYIAVNTSVVTLMTVYEIENILWWILVSVIGTIVCITWLYTINSYCQLNKSKFEIIRFIEEKLPISLYTYEWDLLERGKNKKKYWQLSNLEKILPIVFILIYFSLCIFFIILKSN